MTRRKAIVGLLLLAALVAAYAAVPSSATVSGTTAFTCENTGKGEFTGPHCGPPEGGSGVYQPVAVKEKLFTEVFASGVAWKVKGTVAGVALELEAGQAIFNSTVRNIVVGSEHLATGVGILHLREIKVLKPAGEGCEVHIDESGKVGAKEQLNSTDLLWTTYQQGDAIKFAPVSGEKEMSMSFYLQGCKNPGFNGTYAVFGSFKTTSVAGATVSFTEAGVTAQKTLVLEGSPLGIEGTLTFEGREKETESLFVPLSFTTVGT